MTAAIYARKSTDQSGVSDDRLCTMPNTRGYTKRESGRASSTSTTTSDGGYLGDF